MKQDKRLTVNPMSYKGLHDYPTNKMAHGKDCTYGGTSDNPAPCYACTVAARATVSKSNLQNRKRITGYKLATAFFHP